MARTSRLGKLRLSCGWQGAQHRHEYGQPAPGDAQCDRLAQVQPAPTLGGGVGGMAGACSRWTHRAGPAARRPCGAAGEAANTAAACRVEGVWSAGRLRSRLSARMTCSRAHIEPGGRGRRCQADGNLRHRAQLLQSALALNRPNGIDRVTSAVSWCRHSLSFN